MLGRWKIELLFVVLVALALGGLYQYDRWSDSRPAPDPAAELVVPPPTAPTDLDSQAWERTLHDTTREYRPTPAAFPAAITSTTQGNQIQFSWTTVPVRQPQDPLVHEPIEWRVITAGPDFVARLTSATATLRMLGVSYPDAQATATQTSWGGRAFTLSPAFFTPDGQRLTFEEVRAWAAGWAAYASIESFYGDSGGWPEVRFLVQSDVPVASILRLRVMDAVTHKELSSGYSSSVWNGWFDLKATVRTWRPRPIDFVIDLPAGPEEIIERPARVGEEFQFSGKTIKLIAAADCENGSSSTGEAQVSFTARGAGGGEPEFCLVMMQDDPADAWTAVEALDAQGASIASRGSSRGVDLQIYEFTGDLAQAATVRVRYRRAVERVIFHLPDLPGLPESNRGVTDLLETRVPYVRWNNDYDLRDTVENLLDCKAIAYSGGLNQGTPFVSNSGMAPATPVELRDVTARQLLSRYASNFPQSRLRVDAEQREVQFRTNENPIGQLIKR